MKNYKEVTRALLERRDQYAAEQKRKRKRIVSVTTSFCCFCLVVLLGFGVWNSGMFDIAPPISLDNPINGENGNSAESTVPDNNDSENNNTSENGNQTPASNPVNGYPNLSTLTFEQWVETAGVVWKDGSPTKGNIATGLTVEMGNTMITDELAADFARNGDDTIYAIMVDFTPMLPHELIFEGKTLSEWSEEKDSLIAQGLNEEAKAIAQKISTAKEIYYFEQMELFRGKFAAMGLGVYHEERGCTIDNCIFYTFATRSQIEEFVCGSDTAFIFTKAVRFK